MVKRKPIAYLNILRVTAITGVLLTHVFMTTCGSWAPVLSVNEMYFCIIFRNLWHWCVPVLVMISGVLFLNPERNLPVSKITLKTVPFFAPDGWRYPETAKELGDFPIRLKNDKNLFTIVEADFNGDGLQDAVAYLLNDNTEQTALFMHLSKQGGSYSLEPYGCVDKNTIIEKGVFLAPAGEYANASSYQKFTTRHDGFLIVIFNEAATLHYIDDKGAWQSAPVGKKF
jgi:hypothetical protein